MKSLLGKLQLHVLLSLLVINFCPAYSEAENFTKPLSIKEILNKFKIAESDLSLQILDGEKDITSINAAKPKIPASISKLMTSYGILKKLPPGHRFYTRLFTDEKNIYLKGGGDPSFVSENMWYLVNELSRSGIKKFSGDIVVDDSIFDDVRYDQSRESTRVDRAYDAPVGAMSFNWNSVNVFIRPTSNNKKAQVTIDPESKYFDLVNSVTTISFKPKSDIVVNISNAKKLITVSGNVNVDAPEKAIFKNVEAPDLWSGVNLKFFLAQRGITVEGKVRNGITPANAMQLASYESKSLGYIMADMNKFSNNFVAEMLTKSLAVEEGKQATLKKGVELINEELRKIGLTENEVIFKNPSGLTRENSFSAVSMNKVLNVIKNDFSMFPTFLASLPIAGVDGTMKRRLKNTGAEGWVRAKTGSIDGVVTLAGYAGRHDGKLLTFAFLYNGPRDELNVREAFDQILLNSLQ